MSMQTQPQMQQQQPVDVYPDTMTRQSVTNHSDGSFGTVFIVLAVIVVISGIACCLGRLCNKGAQKTKPKPRQSQQETSRPREDIELGFDPKRFPTPRPLSNDGPRGFRPHENDGFKDEKRVAFKPLSNGGPKVFRPHENGGVFKGEKRVAAEIELKPRK